MYKKFKLVLSFAVLVLIFFLILIFITGLSYIVIKPFANMTIISDYIKIIFIILVDVIVIGMLLVMFDDYIKEITEK